MKKAGILTGVVVAGFALASKAQSIDTSFSHKGDAYHLKQKNGETRISTSRKGRDFIYTKDEFGQSYFQTMTPSDQNPPSKRQSRKSAETVDARVK